jgi:formylglycine-generating enzyme required for sulfatase activity
MTEQELPQLTGDANPESGAAESEPGSQERQHKVPLTEIERVIERISVKHAANLAALGEEIRQRAKAADSEQPIAFTGTDEPGQAVTEPATLSPQPEVTLARRSIEANGRERETVRDRLDVVERPRERRTSHISFQTKMIVAMFVVSVLLALLAGFRLLFADMPAGDQTEGGAAASLHLPLTLAARAFLSVHATSVDSQLPESGANVTLSIGADPSPSAETPASSDPISATLQAVPTASPPPEGMALIPAGHFLMGSPDGQENEVPEHPVLLDAFYLDLYEVTNAQYRACVAASVCTPGNSPNGYTRNNYRNDSAYDPYPVVHVTWDQAIIYCGWVGKRIPTEAEWEYAASGPENLTWPWGNTFDPSKSAASAPDTQPAGSYPDGVSPFGVFDMAGNVAEWVVDVYREEYYANAPASNPVSAGSDDIRIYRGGAFATLNSAIYTTSRRFLKPRAFSDVDIGFRCAKDADDVAARLPEAQQAALVKDFCRIFAEYKPGIACP